jgi:hypothetical protein
MSTISSASSTSSSISSSSSSNGVSPLSQAQSAAALAASFQQMHQQQQQPSQLALQQALMTAAALSASAVGSPQQAMNGSGGLMTPEQRGLLALQQLDGFGLNLFKDMPANLEVIYLILIYEFYHY